MAGIFDRIGTIVKANINELIDKFEDPEKLIDQTIIDAVQEYGTMKKASLDVLANETLTKKQFDELKKEAETWHSIAVKALTAGNEADAKKALEKENDCQMRAASQESAYLAAKQAADTVRGKLRQMEDEINDMKQKAAQIKAKAVTAKVTKKATELSSRETDRGAFDAFARMEEKADRELARAQAAEALSTSQSDAEEEELMKKYASSSSSDADLALEKLKAELGL